MQIVIGAPGRHGCPDVGERWEQGLIEQFVPQPAVEALDERILDWLARGNVVPVDPIRSAKPRMALDVNSVPTAQYSARPPLAHPIRSLEMGDSIPLGGGRYHFFPRRSLSAALSSMLSASNFLSRGVLVLKSLLSPGLADIHAAILGLCRCWHC